MESLLAGILLLTWQVSPRAISQEVKGEPKPQQVAGVEPVIITVTVTNDRGEYVRGLKPDSFSILDEKAPQKVAYFNNDDVPISVGLVVDLSGSVAPATDTTSTIRIVRDAVTHFLQLSNASNEYFLLGFSPRAQLLQDWTTNVRLLLDKLASVQLKPPRGLIDAFYLAIEKTAHSHFSKRVLILISDGKNDDRSQHTLKDIQRSLKESNVIVYSINILGGYNVGGSLANEGQAILNDLSLVSGGMTFYRKEAARFTVSGVNSVFETLAEELRHQYLVGFYPLHNGKWHQIKIKVLSEAGASGERRHLTLRTRQGYFAN